MNPFEIRLELLKLAQTMETERLLTERSRLENDWHASVDMARRDGKALPAFPKVDTVSVEEVVTIAERLNSFISNNPETSKAN